jgi:hypothetical protein
MALQPSLRPLLVAGQLDAPHTLDVFGMGIEMLSTSANPFFHSRLRLPFQVCYPKSLVPPNPRVPLYSAKIIKTIDTVLKPLLSHGGKYASKVKLIIRLQVQPWHGSSTFTHEAALAVHPFIHSAQKKKKTHRSVPILGRSSVPRRVLAVHAARKVLSPHPPASADRAHPQKQKKALRQPDRLL